MLNFKQFVIREDFFKGVKGEYDYIEVFKNPTRAEMKEVSTGSAHQQIGAIVTGRNLYVWNRNSGDHADVKGVVPRVREDWLPLYLYYNASKNSVEIDVSSFSMHSTERFDYKVSDMVEICKKHPAFKIFDKVGLMRY